jgi:O-antigen ligase
MRLSNRAGAALLPAIDLPTAFWTGLVIVGALLAGLAAVAQPAKTLVVIAALAVVGLLLLRTELAVMLVVASAPLELAVTATFGGLSLTKIAGALCFTSFALYALRSHEKLLLDRSHALVLVILGAAMVSSLQAREVGEALSTTGRYASFAAFYIVLTQFARDPKVQRLIAWVLTLTSAGVAAFALNEYLKGNVLVATPLAETNPNDFAFIIGTSLPFAFWLLSSRPALRGVAVLAIGVISAAVLLSLSRGAMLGIAAGIAFLVVTDRRRARIMLIGGSIAIVGALLVIRADPAKFQQALFRKEVAAGHNVTTRLEAWNAAANLAADHPVFGIGPGNFRFYYYEATGNPPGTEILAVVHDAYLDVAAELGFLAAFAFLVYLGMSLARLTAAVRAGTGPPGYAQAVRVSLVIAVVAAIFISEQYFLPFWLLGGLATALWQDFAREAPSEDARLRRTSV